MSKKTPISSEAAPAPIGPYSQAIAAGDLVFVSGQVPLDPRTNRLVEGDVAAQAERVLLNLTAVLEAADLTPGDVVKTTIYLADMADFPRVNEVYARFFPSTPPARATVGVAALPLGARVEMDLIAAR